MLCCIHTRSIGKYAQKPLLSLAGTRTTAGWTKIKRCMRVGARDMAGGALMLKEPTRARGYDGSSSLVHRSLPLLSKNRPHAAAMGGSVSVRGEVCTRQRCNTEYPYVVCPRDAALSSGAGSWCVCNCSLFRHTRALRPVHPSSITHGSNLSLSLLPLTRRQRKREAGGDRGSFARRSADMSP